MLFPKSRHLITYHLSETIFNLVNEFVLKYLSQSSKLSYLNLEDQIIKTAKSIKKNIIKAFFKVDSLKNQIKLLGVTYTLVEKLIVDFEDFLRRKKLEIYHKNHPKVAIFWHLSKNLNNISNLDALDYLKEKPALPTSPQDAANLILTFCYQLSYLLYKQIKTTKEKFIEKKGYSKNLCQKDLKQLKLTQSTNLIKLIGAFTLIEILVIISLIALLALAALVLLDPKKQIEKAWDGKRKHELAQLKKVLEDWYNDKNCYPRPNEICYSSVDSNNTCLICGNHPQSPPFTPYLSSLPCDPQYPQKNYLYQVDNVNCPGWYRIYADLSLSNYIFNDPATEEIGCHNQSCGPAPNYGYDYGISSSNIDLERATSFYYCAKSGCNACGPPPSKYEDCLQIPLDQFCEGVRRIIPEYLCKKPACPCSSY